MKNVTISMSEDLLREARIEAAKAGMSMSRFIADLVDKGLRVTREESGREERQRRMAALERFLSGPKLNISENGRMPTADERNARR
jgi:hypothetical protein